MAGQGGPGAPFYREAQRVGSLAGSFDNMKAAMAGYEPTRTRRLELNTTDAGR